MNVTGAKYTIQLKARKLSGSEGFLISFLSQDPNGKSWWNLGGWGNREHGIESDGMAASHVAGQIETGRWYDIRIEVAGPGVRCFLDDQLVHEVKQGQLSALYAVAGSKRDTGEVILKVVCAFERAPDDDHLAGRHEQGCPSGAGVRAHVQDAGR